MWILSWRSSCWNVDPCVLVWMTLRPTTVGGWPGAAGAMRTHFSTNKPVPLHQACWHAGALHHDPVACDLLSLGIKSYFCCHQKLRMSMAAGYLCSICRHPQMFLRQILLHDSLILILTKASINTGDVPGACTCSLSFLCLNMSFGFWWKNADEIIGRWLWMPSLHQYDSMSLDDLLTVNPCFGLLNFVM
jgi:hypothetical protein